MENAGVSPRKRESSSRYSAGSGSTAGASAPAATGFLRRLRPPRLPRRERRLGVAGTVPSSATSAPASTGPAPSVSGSSRPSPRLGTWMTGAVSGLPFSGRFRGLLDGSRPARPPRQAGRRSRHRRSRRRRACASGRALRESLDGCASWAGSGPAARRPARASPPPRPVRAPPPRLSPRPARRPRDSSALPSCAGRAASASRRAAASPPPPQARPRRRPPQRARPPPRVSASDAGSSPFFLRGARVGFSAWASAVSGTGCGHGRGIDERRVGDPVEHAHDPHVDLLTDELGGVADADGDPVERADRRGHVVQADLIELHLDLGALLDRSCRCQRGDRAFLEHDEVVERHTVARLDLEALLRQSLDLDEPCRSGPDHHARDVGVQLDAERLRPRAVAELTQLALGVDRCRAVGVDDAVARAGRALAGEDLARPVGDVLARHLDEAER